MTEIIPQDKQVALIDIYFAIIITVGLDHFINDFLFNDHLKQLDLFHALNLFYNPQTLFNILFFVSVYVWLILHWIIYHKLINIRPYEGSPPKFLIDIAMFSIIFLILGLSFYVYSGLTFCIFVLFFAILHVLGFAWFSLPSASKKGQYSEDAESKNKSLDRHDRSMHIICLVVYTIWLISFVLTTLLTNAVEKSTIRYAIMVTVILTIFGFSIGRSIVYRKEQEEIELKIPKENERIKEVSSHYIKGKATGNYRWFFLEAKNHHKQKTAINCVIYLQYYRALSDNNPNLRSPDAVEFKWKGVNAKDVIIRPNRARRFDAFYVCKCNPRQVHLGINEELLTTIDEEYQKAYTLESYEDATFELCFRLFSLNFSHEEKKFILHIDNDIFNVDGSKSEKVLHEITHKCYKCDNRRELISKELAYPITYGHRS